MEIGGLREKTARAVGRGLIPGTKPIASVGLHRLLKKSHLKLLFVHRELV
jgi:hypothetical protein